jgi:hypothetical protein
MGAEMDLEVELNALHLFDAASEQRLSSKPLSSKETPQ